MIQTIKTTNAKLHIPLSINHFYFIRARIQPYPLYCPPLQYFKNTLIALKLLICYSQKVNLGPCIIEILKKNWGFI